MGRGRWASPLPRGQASAPWAEGWGPRRSQGTLCDSVERLKGLSGCCRPIPPCSGQVQGREATFRLGAGARPQPGGALGTQEGVNSGSRLISKADQRWTLERQDGPDVLMEASGEASKQEPLKGFGGPRQWGLKWAGGPQGCQSCPGRPQDRTLPYLCFCCSVSPGRGSQELGVCFLPSLQGGLAAQPVPVTQ